MRFLCQSSQINVHMCIQSLINVSHLFTNTLRRTPITFSKMKSEKKESNRDSKQTKNNATCRYTGNTCTGTECNLVRFDCNSTFVRMIRLRCGNFGFRLSAFVFQTIALSIANRSVHCVCLSHEIYCERDESMINSQSVFRIFCLDLSCLSLFRGQSAGRMISPTHTSMHAHRQIMRLQQSTENYQTPSAHIYSMENHRNLVVCFQFHIFLLPMHRSLQLFFEFRYC